MEQIKNWGQLTTIDLFECKHELLIDKNKFKNFCLDLCKEINMMPYGSTRIERFGSGDIEGYSLFQFIETSSITVHLDEINNRAFIDVFSCKKFSEQDAVSFSKEFFNAKKIKVKTLYRG